MDVVGLIDLFLHLDRFLVSLFQEYGPWTYAVLFLVLFCETGLVVAPFLPGDSLLFATGALVVRAGPPEGSLMSVFGVVLLLSVAAILGDAVNYAIGYRMGPIIFAKEGTRWLHRNHLDRARDFYERHGGTAIIMARFIPILRTFAPFVAGIGKMTYWRFAIYNVVGGIAWVALCVFSGYLFGHLPIVKDNFAGVIMAIVVVSILPVLFELVRGRIAAASAKSRS